MNKELQDKLVLSAFLALTRQLDNRYIWDMYRWKTGDTYSTNSSLFIWFAIEALYKKEARSEAIRKAYFVLGRVSCSKQAFDSLPPRDLQKSIQDTIELLDAQTDATENQELSYEEYIKQMDY